MKIKKLLPCLLAFAAMPALASGVDAVPKKAGPVSYYGALHTSGGKIIGSKNNQEAVVRGMSLFWSDATGLPYYSKTVLDWAVDNLHIDVIRFAMGIHYYNSDGGKSNALFDGYSYYSAPDSYKLIIDRMVEAAVENDIYIILDWHSHHADEETGIASAFFTEMAEKYKNVPNVIFEIFNEPVKQGWSTILQYASTVVPGIRKNSDNLVVVGTPSWSQLNNFGGVSGGNIAYALHFYAATHSWGTYGTRALKAKGDNSAVFVTEWGSVAADGKGDADDGATSTWLTNMDANNLSNCNWSLRQTSGEETSAMFEGSEELTTRYQLDNATYSKSGKITKEYLKKNARSWADSLVKGRNVGACAFKAFSASELDGTVAGKLGAGCSYTSSNENVVSGTGEIKGSGMAILTGNDNSQSVVTITAVPDQSVPNFKDLTCNYSGSCTLNRAISYSGSPNKEWVIALDAKTLEGASFTLTSLNPEIVTVKKATCSSAACSNSQLNKQVLMYEFKGFGTAKIVASAPAIPGFRAVQDTIEVTYNKGYNQMTKNFKDTKLEFGANSPKLVPDTTMYHTPVTYTFNGEPTSPYVTKEGNGLTAGTQNAVVRITANAPETDFYQEFHKSITVIVGDSTAAVNKEEFDLSGVIATNVELPLRAVVTKSQLAINSDNMGDVKVNVFSLNGQKVISQTVSANAMISLADVPNGSYLIVITQGLKQLNIRWSKTAR